MWHNTVLYYQHCYVTLYDVLLYDVEIYDVSLYGVIIIWCFVIWCYVILLYVILLCIIWCFVISLYILWCFVLWWYHSMMFCHMMLHHIIVMLPYLISSCSIMSNDTAVTLLLHSAYRVRGCTHNMRNTELSLKSCSGTVFYVKPWYRYYRVRGRELLQQSSWARFLCRALVSLLQSSWARTNCCKSWWAYTQFGTVPI